MKSVNSSLIDMIYNPSIKFSSLSHSSLFLPSTPPRANTTNLSHHKEKETKKKKKVTKMHIVWRKSIIVAQTILGHKRKMHQSINQTLTRSACHQKGARTYHKILIFNSLHFTLQTKIQITKSGRQ